MKIACISDVHAQVGSDSYKLLNSFFNQKETVSADKVFLLGDVFDLMVGDFPEYTQIYNEYFSNLSKCLERGQDVVVFEGNHDFHLESVYKRYDKRIKYIKDELILNINDKNYYFTHGDVVDVNNMAYARWKKIYTSTIFGLFLKYILPLSVVLKLGNKASNDSKQRGRKSFDKEKFREKYRNGAISLLEGKGVDCLVCGHTHIQENYSHNSKRYINIGFPPKSKQFLFLEDAKAEFKLIV